MLSDIVTFVRAWARNPGGIGAIAPSGDALARLITRGINADDRPVLELGPGTGVFTRALLARGIAESNLILIEANAAFARRLRQRYPEAHVLCMDASHIGLGETLVQAQIGAVVSGLPLLAMPSYKVTAILEGVFMRMAPDGAFYQFTYGLKCPIAATLLDGLGLQATRVGTAMRNVPPASVYLIARRGRP